MRVARVLWFFTLCKSVVLIVIIELRLKACFVLVGTFSIVIPHAAFGGSNQEEECKSNLFDSHDPPSADKTNNFADCQFNPSEAFSKRHRRAFRYWIISFS